MRSIFAVFALALALTGCQATREYVYSKTENTWAKSGGTGCSAARPHSFTLKNRDTGKFRPVCVSRATFDKYAEGANYP